MKRRTFRVWTKSYDEDQFSPNAGPAMTAHEAADEARVMREHGVNCKVLPEIEEESPWANGT